VPNPKNESSSPANSSSCKRVLRVAAIPVLAAILAAGCSVESGTAHEPSDDPTPAEADVDTQGHSSKLPSGFGRVPVSGMASFVEVRIEAGEARFGSVRVKPGSFAFRTKDPFGPGIETDTEARQVVVRDGLGSEILRTRVAVTTWMTVPEPSPNDPSGTRIGMVDVSSASSIVSLPVFDVDAVAELYEPGSTSPSDVIALPATKPPAKTMDLPSPPPAEPGTFHLSIVASGFDSETLPAFRRKAELVRDYLMAREPFADTRPGAIAVHIVENTADVGCAAGCAGIDRLLCCRGSDVLTALNNAGERYDEILVIHNSTTYSGGGSRDRGVYEVDPYSTMAQIYSGRLDDDDGWFGPAMAVHELGHSVANLCDEYSYSSEGYSYHDCVNCREDCSSWSDSDPVCTLGCDARQDYRRPSDSIMYSYGVTTFNSPSARELERRLRFFGVSAYCTASLAQNYAVHIPAVLYDGPQGQMLFWADLAQVPTTDGSLMYRVTAYGEVARLSEFSECDAAKLSKDLELTLPFLQLAGPGGSSYFWAKLDHIPGTNLDFLVTSYGSM
jgi:hypothetical protein